MARFREFRRDSCCRDGCEVPRNSEVQVVRGFGTINSTGVLPSGQDCPSVTNEVEFSINISRIGRCYQGEVYIVDYDTREKISSNKLVFFEQFNEIQIITIFIVECGNRNCTFEMVVSLSPSNCTGNANGKFFAYVPAILNQGLNIGGNLRTGEIKVCGQSCCHSNECHSRHSCHSCNNTFALSGRVLNDEFEESDCVLFNASNLPNSCCSNRGFSNNDNNQRNRNNNFNDNINMNRNHNVNDNINMNRNVNTNINTNINNNINNNINGNPVDEDRVNNRSSSNRTSSRTSNSKNVNTESSKADRTTGNARNKNR